MVFFPVADTTGTSPVRLTRTERSLLEGYESTQPLISSLFPVSVSGGLALPSNTVAYDQWAFSRSVNISRELSLENVIPASGIRLTANETFTYPGWILPGNKVPGWTDYQIFNTDCS